MRKYLTPSAAEMAFYSAFEQADLVEMMNIWANDDAVVCIHPGASRLDGAEELRNSWRQLFSDPPLLKFSLIDVRKTAAGDIAVHYVREEIEIDGQYISMMLSTNIYQRNDDKSWQMTSRHTSPEPEYEMSGDFYDEEEVVFH